MRLRNIAAAFVALAIVVVGVRVIVHDPKYLSPALIMPDTDVHRAVSQALDARLARLASNESAFGRGGRPKLVALTFDDGPYPVETPLLLSALRDLDVHATFFLIGRDAEQYPALARRIVAGGHEIANHTESHPNLDLLPAAGVRDELTAGAASLAAIAPDPSEARYFRPPHGRFTEETLVTAQHAGYTTVLWNDDPGDWRAIAEPRTVAAHLFAHATAPDIVLLHSGKLSTVAMLPEVVGGFRKAGFRFVTVRELLATASSEEIVHPQRLPVPPPSGT